MRHALCFGAVAVLLAGCTATVKSISIGATVPILHAASVSTGGPSAAPVPSGAVPSGLQTTKSAALPTLEKVSPNLPASKPDPCPACLVVKSVSGGDVRMVAGKQAGSSVVWLYRLTGGHLTGALQLGADLAGGYVVPGGLGCTGSICVATIGYGAHGARAIVADFNAQPLALGQSIDGFDGSVVTATAVGLMVGLTARDPNMMLSNAEARRFWKTWTLQGNRLIAGGCSGYGFQLGETQPTGRCPPITTYVSGLQQNRDPLLDGPITAGQPVAVTGYLKGSTGVEFTSPSGNLWCVIRGPGAMMSATCEIGVSRYPVPPRPMSAECQDGFGPVVQVTARGSMIPCTDPIHRTDQVLPFGSTIAAWGVNCLMTRSGVKCLNGAGHGFILSQDELTLL